MDTQELLLTAGRAVLVYVVFLVIIRLLGKRTVGNVTPFDFLVALMLGEVVDEIIYGDVNLVQGFAATLVIAALHWLNSWFSFKNSSFERLTGGSATLLVKHGAIQRDGMASERISEGELWEELRQMEIDDLAEIKAAHLETTGRLSVLREDWAKALQKGDLRQATPDDKHPSPAQPAPGDGSTPSVRPS